MKRKMIIGIITIVLLGIIFILVGFLTSRGIQVNSHEIDKDYEIKIAQFSDTHFDDHYDRDDYDSFIESINSVSPDVIFFTGDLFQTHSVSDTLHTEIVSLLSELEGTHKLAVLGNHDYYPGDTFKDEVIEILEEAGFTVLINENIVLDINDTLFNFIGFDDYMMGNGSYSTVLKTIDSTQVNMVLSHEPDTFPYIFDTDAKIMFSGHSHGGQIRLPLIGDIINVPGAKKYNEHHYQENEKDLYVSFGMGESMIRVRFFNKRQVEIYDFS